MLRIGDKVVYTAITTYRYTKGKIYTIEHIYKTHENKTCYTINGLDTYINNFKPLAQVRKQKLQKICSKLEIK